eukprot:14272-Heterococcus_DN1.PRE.2
MCGSGSDSPASVVISISDQNIVGGSSTPISAITRPPAAASAIGVRAYLSSKLPRPVHTLLLLARVHAIGSHRWCCCSYYSRYCCHTKQPDTLHALVLLYALTLNISYGCLQQLKCAKKRPMTAPSSPSSAPVLPVYKQTVSSGSSSSSSIAV